MEKRLLGLSILFIVLTFVGAGYVLSTGGQSNAGYAVIPMNFALVFTMVYRKQKNSSAK
ncbi:hypothetical protein V6615_09255 [Oscillospiraceae bacterium PP1C4]